MQRLRFKAELCVGCRVCEMVCSSRHFGEFNPKRARLRVIPKDHTRSVLDYCRHCAKPKCMEACPTGAIITDESNPPMVVVVDELCNGCGECVRACPFDAMYMDTARPVALKCDLCQGETWCVRYCPQSAIEIKG